MTAFSHMRLVLLATLAGGNIILAQATSAAAATPFSALAGTWSGSGQVRFSQSQSEQISCRAYYTAKPEESQLSLALRCASSSYKIEMRAQLNSAGNQISGRWEERTFNAEGVVRGHSDERSLTLAVGGAVTGSIKLSLDQAAHRVEINTSTAGLNGVSINLVRG